MAPCVVLRAGSKQALVVGGALRPLGARLSPSQGL